MEFLPFTVPIIYWIAALVVLLFLSAIASGSETSLLSLRPSKLAELRAEKSGHSHQILALLEDPNRLLSTILIFNNLVNIGAILCANSAIDLLAKFSSSGIEFLVKVIVVTIILLIFGEIMPKVLATYYPLGFARRTAPFMSLLSRVLWPLSWVLTKAGGAITSMLSHSHDSVSMDQLQEALEITQSDTADDKKMLSSIVSFVGRDAVEIMKPRVDVVAIDVSTPFDKVLATIVHSAYSRLPVYDESFDNIKGILFIKDLLPHLSEKSDFEWQKLLREPYFVPENKKINDLLEDFQAKRQHLAIVVDEYGGALGVVTLEDILEEVVGEIADESDSASDFYRQLSPSSYLFDGGTHLSDFARILDIDSDLVDEVKGEADTLAGLMIEIRGEFFNPADEVLFAGLTLRADEVDAYRITKVMVKKEL